MSSAPAQRIRAVDLGARLGWEKSRLSKQVTCLEARGLVHGEDCRAGQCGTDSLLTAAGRKSIQAATLPGGLDQPFEQKQVEPRVG